MDIKRWLRLSHDRLITVLLVITSCLEYVCLANYSVFYLENPVQMVNYQIQGVPPYNHWPFVGFGDLTTARNTTVVDIHLGLTKICLRTFSSFTSLNINGCYYISGDYNLVKFIPAGMEWLTSYRKFF